MICLHGFKSPKGYILYCDQLSLKADPCKGLPVLCIHCQHFPIPSVTVCEWATEVIVTAQAALHFLSYLQYLVWYQIIMMPAQWSSQFMICLWCHWTSQWWKRFRNCKWSKCFLSRFDRVILYFYNNQTWFLYGVFNFFLLFHKSAIWWFESCFVFFQLISAQNWFKKYCIRKDHLPEVYLVCTWLAVFLKLSDCKSTVK